MSWRSSTSHDARRLGIHVGHPGSVGRLWRTALAQSGLGALGLEDAMAHHIVDPRFAVITASSSGNTELVAAVTGRAIRVLAYNYVVNGAVNVSFRSGTSTVIGGLGYWGEQGRGKAPGYCPEGFFQTASGEALNINLSGNVAVGGEVTYVLVPY